MQLWFQLRLERVFVKWIFTYALIVTCYCTVVTGDNYEFQIHLFCGSSSFWAITAYKIAGLKVNVHKFSFMKIVQEWSQFGISGFGPKEEWNAPHCRMEPNRNSFGSQSGKCSVVRKHTSKIWQAFQRRWY